MPSPVTRSMGSRLRGSGSCGLWGREHRFSNWCAGFIVPQHVESSWTRELNLCPYTDRQTPIHCTTRKSTRTCLVLHLKVGEKAPVLESICNVLCNAG